MKIFEQGWNTFKAMKDLNDAWVKGGLSLNSVKTTISRKGSSKEDTRYSFFNGVNPQLSPEQLQQIGALKTLQLDPLAKPGDESAPREPWSPPPTDEGKPPF
jgi:hypothetical protein